MEPPNPGTTTPSSLHGGKALGLQLGLQLPACLSAFSRRVYFRRPDLQLPLPVSAAAWRNFRSSPGLHFPAGSGRAGIGSCGRRGGVQEVRSSELTCSVCSARRLAAACRTPDLVFSPPRRSQLCWAFLHGGLERVDACCELLDRDYRRPWREVGTREMLGIELGCMQAQQASFP